jgi:hypothetical protein
MANTTRTAAGVVMVVFAALALLMPEPYPVLFVTGACVAGLLR